MSLCLVVRDVQLDEDHHFETSLETVKRILLVRRSLYYS